MSCDETSNRALASHANRALASHETTRGTTRYQKLQQIIRRNKLDDCIFTLCISGEVPLFFCSTLPRYLGGRHDSMHGKTSGIIINTYHRARDWKPLSI